MSAFRHGDIVIATFDPSMGHEANKTRPAVVTSNDDFNDICDLSITGNAAPRAELTAFNSLAPIVGSDCWLIPFYSGQRDA